MDKGSLSQPVEVEGPTRRRFYTGAIYAIGGIIGAALSAPALVYLFFSPKARKESEWVDAGDVASLAPNQPVEMVFRRNRVDGWKVVSEKGTAWVVKNADQSVTAFGSQCTHLGCAYHWEDGKNEFVCPCHNSLFPLEGKVLSGPAPRPLDRYDTKVQGGKLLLGSLRQSSGSGA
jgi:menaquinol-cytochrome c reductase iron-sulfur subunit